MTDKTKTLGELTDADLSELADKIRDHMNVNENHEAGLIPMGTCIFLSKIADGLKPAEPVIEERVSYWVNHDKDWDAALPMKETYRDGKLVSVHWEAEEDK